MNKIMNWFKVFIFVIVFLFLSIYSYSQLHVDTTRNISVYKNLFFAPDCGVKVENFRVIGNIFSIGYFQNHCVELQIEKGIILSTGYVIDAIGPNDKTNSGANVHCSGDRDLDFISNGKTFDAITLEFDFIPNSDSVSFDYIFASEEYPEYVNKGLNDAFAFYLSKSQSTERINIAILPNSNQTITVNNINSLNNSKFFISNTDKYSCLFYSLQFDGLSTKLNTGYKVNPYQKYHIKLCISDVGDGYFDSVVLLNANSFRSSGTFNFTNLTDTILSLSENVEIVEEDSNQVLFIPNIEFDFNSYVINDNSYDILNKLATLFLSYFDFHIDIGGYSDAIGNNKYNMNLSLKRAESVAAYLVSKGVDSNRINIYGFGSTNPIADNITVSGRAKNRRVTFKIVKFN
jgi:outer membrane protein OmpA-like peptidoglycan-associated protein